MKLFLIRHGETVDNVAQVYAGVKDSPLTIHGSLQAERLGKYFTGTGLRFSHLFSSDLQRAFKTATAIWTTQPHNDDSQSQGKLEVTALTILREQNFGFYEGKPFYARSRVSDKSGKENHRSQHQDHPDFKDVESKESMVLRMNVFLQDYLVPILHSETGGTPSTVAIVSHGIILSHLWRCFLKLLPRGSVTLSPGLSVGGGGVTPLEYLGGWSNTGFLELDVQKDHNKPTTATGNIAAPSAAPLAPEPSSLDTVRLLILQDHRLLVKTVNGKEHLKDFKRTKGGVGSSRFDESQQSIESFFKKRKV